MSTITPQQKMYIAAGANALFAICLFFPWFGAGPFSTSGYDSLPTAWIPMLFAVAAAVLLAAQAFDYDLPVRVPPFAAAAYLSSVPLIITLMIFLEADGGRKFGLFLGLLASGAATAFSTMLWREEG
jgi:hypothetical protein